MTEPNKSTLFKLYDFLASRNIIIISLVATSLLIILQYRIDQQISGDGPGSMYLQLAFSRNNFESILASWGSAGISRYIQTLWIDFLLPICAAFLLSSATISFQRKQTKTPGKLEIFFMLIPFFYMLTDYTENILHLIILKRHFFENWIIFTSSIISLIKLILLYTGIGWMLKSYRNFRKPAGPPVR